MSKTFPVVGSARPATVDTNTRFSGLTNHTWATISEKTAKKRELTQTTASISEPSNIKGSSNSPVTAAQAAELPFDVEITPQPLHRVAKPVKETAALNTKLPKPKKAVKIPKLPEPHVQPVESVPQLPSTKIKLHSSVAAVAKSQENKEKSQKTLLKTLPAQIDKIIKDKAESIKRAATSVKKATPAPVKPVAPVTKSPAKPKAKAKSEPRPASLDSTLDSVMAKAQIIKDKATIAKQAKGACEVTKAKSVAKRTVRKDIKPTKPKAK